MSRTYRKRVETYESYWKNMVAYGFHTYNKREKAKYYSDAYDRRYFRETLPREFRNSVNKQRRARDRQALYREVNGFVGNFSKWNCKDNNAWGYW